MGFALQVFCSHMVEREGRYLFRVEIELTEIDFKQLQIRLVTRNIPKSRHITSRACCTDRLSTWREFVRICSSFRFGAHHAVKGRGRKFQVFLLSRKKNVLFAK